MRQITRIRLFVCLLSLVIITACYGEEVVVTRIIVEEGVTTEEAATELAAITRVVEEVVTEVVVVEVTRIVEEVFPDNVSLMGWSNGSEIDDLQRALMEECGVSYDLGAGYADYWDSLPLMFAAGDAPDILYIDTEHLPSFAEQGFLVPPDEIYPIDWDLFLDATVEAFSYQRVPFAVPWEFSTLALYYNRQMFEEVGLDTPHDDWTWDDLRDASWHIIETSGRPGFVITSWPYHFVPFVFQSGGQIMSEDFRETGIDSGPAVEAGYFYLEARDVGLAVLPEDVGAGWPGEAFGFGEVAMALEGRWLDDYLRQEFPKLDYGVVQLPAGPSGEGNILFGTGYAVSATSSNLEAARQAIECLTREGAQQYMLESRLLLPTRKEFLDDYYQELAGPAGQANFDGALVATPYSWGPRHDEIDWALGRALELILAGEMAIEDSFAQAAEEIRAIVGQ